MEMKMMDSAVGFTMRDGGLLNEEALFRSQLHHLPMRNYMDHHVVDISQLPQQQTLTEMQRNE